MNKFVARLATDDDVIAANALPRISRTFFFLDYQLGPGRKTSLLAYYSVEFQAEGNYSWSVIFLTR